MERESRKLFAPGMAKRPVRIYGPRGEVISRLSGRENIGKILVLPSGIPAQQYKRRRLDSQGNPVHDVAKFLAERRILWTPPGLMVVAGPKTTVQQMEQHYLNELLRRETDLSAEHLQGLLAMVKAGTIHFDAARAMKETVEQEGTYFPQRKPGFETTREMRRFKPFELATQPLSPDTVSRRRLPKREIDERMRSPYLEALRIELAKRSMQTELWLPRFGKISLLDLFMP